MQEEKNNQHNSAEGKGKRHRPARRHGYFIEPRAESNTDVAKDSAPKNEPNTNTQKKHVDEQKAQEQKSQNNAPSGNKGNANSKNKNNRNKNRNKNNTQRPNEHKDTVAQNKNTIVTEKTAQNTNDKISSRASDKPAKPLVNHSADDYEEYKLEVDAVEPTPMPENIAQEDENQPKTEVVGIRFKSSGKIYYFDPNGRVFKKGSNAIVDTARGQEFGEVAMANTLVKNSDIVSPLRAVVRGATTADIEHHKQNKQKEEEAFKICNEKIAEHHLDMKLIDAQYTFDNSKLLFYFTSSERVDFRELVKDLASVFRTRIELRQIGIRDEAKLMGGLGMCGRPLCCTLFLSDFDQVSIKMAKEQNLSLNSAKISGICGRLMCCLKYEHEAYEYEIKRTPPVDSLVRTPDGDGTVTEISPLRGIIKVRLLATPEVPPKAYKRDDVTMLRKKQSAEKQQND